MTDEPTPEMEPPTAEPAGSPPGPSAPGPPAREGAGRRNLLVGGAVLGVGLLAAAFFVGRATGSDSGTTGPITLAAAVDQAKAGKLACGDLKNLPRAVQQLCPAAASATTAPNEAKGGSSTSAPGGGAAVARNLLVGIVQSVNGQQLQLQVATRTMTLLLTPETSVDTTVKGSVKDLTPGARVIVRPGGAGRGRTATAVVVVPADAIAPAAPTPTAAPTSAP